MPAAEQQLMIAQRRLSEVEALEESLRALRDELARYQGTLARKLALLKQAETVPPPAEPAPASAQDLQSVPEAPPASSQDIISDLEASAEPVQEEIELVPGEIDLVQEEIRAELEVVQSVPAPEAYEDEDEDEGDERRTSTRRKGNPIQLRITRLDNGDLLEGWVVDRSTGGVRLLLDQALPAKTMLSIRPVKAATNYPWIKAEVRSCKPERGGYSIGCMFLQKLTWGELQAFG
jgi:hypothetical protein